MLKKILLIIVAVILVTTILPYIIVYKICGFYSPEDSGGQSRADACRAAESPPVVRVYMHKEDKIVQMDTSDYLKGVVAAEMPASFEYEAIKAQAVAARSYLAAHMIKGAPDSYKGADTSTDSSTCQAWISEADRKAAWKADEADANWDKISRAVEETAGIIMVYGGEPVNAIFHSTSSGQTESAADVWGSDIAYLQSVSSLGDTLSPKYETTSDISVDEFKSVAEANIKGVSWDKGLFSNIIRSNAGGIISIQIGGVTVKGTVFRQVYGLRSTNVQMYEKDGRVYMDAKGYGHGVGMSQYGANYLAAQGQSYEQILKTYYTGVELSQSSVFFG